MKRLVRVRTLFGFSESTATGSSMKSSRALEGMYRDSGRGGTPHPPHSSVCEIDARLVGA